jgi:hypothetical protein
MVIVSIAGRIAVKKPVSYNKFANIFGKKEPLLKIQGVGLLYYLDGIGK